MARTLSQLAARVREQGEGTLAALYGDNPLLVVHPTATGESVVKFDTSRFTLPDETKFEPTLSGKGQVAPPSKASRADGSSVVLPLVKSTRNPFAGVITIGRARNNDLHLNSQEVSKLHAILRRSTDGWVIQDSDSTNGTFVDMMKLEPRVEHALRCGSALGFGAVSATFLTLSGLEGLCAHVAE